jgi:hypothetical protein
MTLGGNLIGVVEGLILRTRIDRFTFEHAAGVLPNLAAIVPLKAKLRKLGGGLLVLLVREGNPDPLADKLRTLEGTAATALEQVENLLCGQLAIALPLRKVDSENAARLGLRLERGRDGLR